MNKRWVQIFKAMGNINRIKIIQMLAKPRAFMSVSQIAAALGVSLKSTSKHLIILTNLDLLESNGKKGHVFYKLNPYPPRDLGRVIKLFCYSQISK